MNAQFFYYGLDHDVALVAHKIQALVIIRMGGKYIAMTAVGCPLSAIQ